jgi:cardiolipin synthase
MDEYFWSMKPHIIGVVVFIISAVATAHVILNKRDTKSAIGWVGLIWFVPLVGAVLYFILGINLIRRKAKTLRPGPQIAALTPRLTEEDIKGHIPRRFHPFTHLADTVVKRPLAGGNLITPLADGDRAFPAMIEAIEGARHSVNLCTYIFDNDRAGRMFSDALSAAVGRGVEARVIVDDVGARYSLPPVTRALRKAGVRVARFMPSISPWRLPFLNLRNHRKILVVDGRTAFTGGMNIREGMLLKENPAHPVRDTHFRVEGPVVAQLQEVFAEDWAFCTGEELRGEEWFPALEPAGSSVARGIPDAPDEDFGRLQMVVHGALAAARHRVTVATPYFTPDGSLIKALNLAALRGLEVDIVLPSANNLPFMKWASAHLLRQLLEHGCRVWFSEPPFDHSKLMVVDGMWSLVGSANWDSRSFRLNFEFSMECYDRALASALTEMIEGRVKGAHRVTLEELNARPLLIKLRDGATCLLSPFL